MTTSTKKLTTGPLERRLIKSIIELHYQNGELTDDDIADTRKIKKKLGELSKTSKFEFIEEHRASIIDSARHFKKQKDRDKAILFYAMFFEHTFNNIIERVCTKRKIERKTITEIIKNISIHGKTSWLLTLMNLPKLNKSHKDLILKVTEERNSFVHYKWTPSADYLVEDEEILNDKIFKQIENTVTYLKGFESKIIFSNKKGHFKKNLKTFFYSQHQ